jgi:hypothetical protein
MIAHDPPVKHFGSEYDGASADGWRVVLRGDDGTLESLAGPFRTWLEANAAFERLLRRKE